MHPHIVVSSFVHVFFFRSKVTQKKKCDTAFVVINIIRRVFPHTKSRNIYLFCHMYDYMFGKIVLFAFTVSYILKWLHT